MSKAYAAQGGKDTAPVKQPIEGGTPQTGKGTSEPPKGDKMLFEGLKGFHGTNPGAH